jgi:putative addiction module component (TIGR02574 family)
MALSLKELGLDRLTAEEKLALIEQIWDSFPVDSTQIPLTDAQREELERRLADHEANPDVVLTWEEVKRSIQNRLKP